MNKSTIQYNTGYAEKLYQKVLSKGINLPLANRWGLHGFPANVFRAVVMTLSTGTVSIQNLLGVAKEVEDVVNKVSIQDSSTLKISKILNNKSCSKISKQNITRNSIKILSNSNDSLSSIEGGFHGFPAATNAVKTTRVAAFACTSVG